MKPDVPIFVAGHRGRVGSALVRALRARGHRGLLLRGSADLDLRDGPAVERFFAEYRPEHVLLAAARVDAIGARRPGPADLLADNLAIQGNVIGAAHRHGVRRLLLLAPSSVYPRIAVQPLREDGLLGGALEPGDRPYVLAKIAGIELIRGCNRQHGTRFTALVSPPVYGPGLREAIDDPYAIPALLHRFGEAGRAGLARLALPGTGTPRRELLHVDDLAAACLHVLTLEDDRLERLAGTERTGSPWPPLLNVGTGDPLTVRELARAAARAAGYTGAIEWDTTQPDGVPGGVLDVTRLHVLGWRARIPLEAGLRETWQSALQPRAPEPAPDIRALIARP